MKFISKFYYIGAGKYDKTTFQETWDFGMYIATKLDYTEYLNYLVKSS